MTTHHPAPATPAVTIVVPTVRIDDHLRIALDSLLAQTFTDFEIVIVLDGVRSANTSLTDDPRVRTLRLPEQTGTANALNKGIAIGRGSLIARLDADDVALPTRLALQIETMATRPELVGLGAGASVVDADGGVRSAIDVATGPGVAPGLLRRNQFVHSSMVFRRDAFERAGGHDPRCVRMQDYDLWLRLAMLGQLDNLAERLVQYRVHDSMHSRSTNPLSESGRRVLASRTALARHLGRSRLAQNASNGTWTASQLARHWGLRRPGYLRAAQRPSRAA
jgi:hypothetical protein